MKLFSTSVLALGLVLSVAGVASAQAPKPLLTVSGGPSGTYFRLMTELNAVCPSMIENKESGGSLDNLSQILGNKAELGITQHDVLYLRSQKEEDVRKRILTLFPLHQEEVHIVAKSAPFKEGGMLGTGLGAKEVILTSLTDLTDRKVGYWGGTKVTVEVLSFLGRMRWQPVEYPDQSKALSALDSGEVAAVIAVGGQPLAWVEKLNRNYKILSVSDQSAGDLKNVYDKTSVTYANLGQEGVQTISVDALLVTRNYSSTAMVAKLMGIKQCAIDKVDELRETRDTHPKWQVIDPAKESKWQMFTAPAPKVGPAANKG